MKTITIQVPDNCEVKIVKKEKEKKEPTIRTYQDLIDNHIEIGGYWISTFCNINYVSPSAAVPDSTDIAASEKVAKRMLAAAMISQLMPYYGGAITDKEWKDGSTDKYTIYRYAEEVNFDSSISLHRFLAFHTAEQRAEFLKYNERLVKDYLMLD